MDSFMVKSNLILRFVSLNIWEFLHVQLKTSSVPKIMLRVILFSL